MLKIKIARLWWTCLIAIAASYPLSVMAANVAAELGMSGLSPPFTPEWMGVWVFSIAGGVSASFVQIEEIDKHLKFSPTVVKIVMGTSGGMAISSAIGTLTDTPLGVISLFAFIASIVSALICIGFMVYVGNQKRQNDVYDMGRDMVTGRIFGRKPKDGDDNEPN